MGRADMDHPWLFERCREVQADPDGYLDLWSREHYKSTIITFGLTIQDILNNPSVTIGIFSHTRPIAKGFLRQIQRELAGNEQLKAWFPDILWDNPKAQAPKWSEDDGLIVKRNSNPKEATIEAHGLVDGQPTSKHFDKLVYDDVVTDKSVTTPEMIAKTTDALALSYNLGARGGSRRFIGTRYHGNDTYKSVLQRKTAKQRVYPATVDGSVDGEPVLLGAEELAQKRRDMGPYIFSCQMLQNPVADEAQGFRKEWLEYHEGGISHAAMNKYILVDPASEKKKTSDYTSIFVVGLGSDKNYYVLDMVRDRLNLAERADAVFELHRNYQPKKVGYEKYGMQADIEHIKYRQAEDNYRFEITPLGGQMKKNDRIKRLVPVFEQHRVYLPPTCNKTSYEGKVIDLVHAFTEEEYKAFPVPLHDDMLDALSRIEDPDMELIWPKAVKRVDRHRRARRAGSTSAWSA